MYSIMNPLDGDIEYIKSRQEIIQRIKWDEYRLLTGNQKRYDLIYFFAVVNDKKSVLCGNNPFNFIEVEEIKKMKADKVYIVIKTNGSYESFSWRICGIFENQLDAEKCCQDINDEDILRKIELQVFAKEYLDIDEDGDSELKKEIKESFENMSEEQKYKIYKDYIDLMGLSDVHEAKVIEKDFNIRIKKEYEENN